MEGFGGKDMFIRCPLVSGGYLTGDQRHKDTAGSMRCQVVDTCILVKRLQPN